MVNGKSESPIRSSTFLLFREKIKACPQTSFLIERPILPEDYALTSIHHFHLRIANCLLLLCVLNSYS